VRKGKILTKYVYCLTKDEEWKIDMCDGWILMLLFLLLCSHVIYMAIRFFPLSSVSTECIFYLKLEN